MKTNRQLLTEIRKGRNVFDIIAEERKEATEGMKEYQDSFWIGALESKLALALGTIKALEDELSYEAAARIDHVEGDVNTFDKSENI